MIRIKREWATPLTAGAFILSSATGVLMFFHLDSGLNKAAHEWFSWALLGGVCLHLTTNWRGFLNHLGSGRGRALIGIFVAVLALSFIQPDKSQSVPSYVSVLKAVNAAPLGEVALLTDQPLDAIIERLTAAGYAGADANTTIDGLTGGDRKKERTLFGVIFVQP